MLMIIYRGIMMRMYVGMMMLSLSYISNVHMMFVIDILYIEAADDSNP